jgi:hypothetical protein
MVTVKQPKSNFPHLSLPLVVRDRARFPSGGNAPEQEKQNKANRAVHGRQLTNAARAAVAAWATNRKQRAKEKLPPLPENIPLFVEVEPGRDLEYLRKHFNLEIVAEHDDGVVLVASPDQDMSTFLATTAKFVSDTRGGATAAKIYGMSGPENPQRRLERLLSENLLEKWSTITDTTIYTVDVAIECLGVDTVPDTPELKDGESEEHFEKRLAKWREKWQAAQNSWDDLMAEREYELMQFIQGYRGEVLDIVHNQHMGVASLPDSFTVRVRVTGKALRDLVLNYPYLFEVSEPDEIVGTPSADSTDTHDGYRFERVAPDEDAPAICIIDSGIQEMHPYLAHAIDTQTSNCYVPGSSATDVADHVRAGGHGTRVAGAVLYPEGIPVFGESKPVCWIQNARVLDAGNRLSNALHPPSYLKAIVEEYRLGERGTRLFNHSIAAYQPCRLRNMSAWAASIDWLSWKHDVLFFQSAGNLPGRSAKLPARLGVLDHIGSGHSYPGYLSRASSRIPSPSESLQAITVGSVGHADHIDLDMSSMAGADRCSAFSTTGLGVWESIKPDVVEYGGDYALDNADPPSLHTPAEICPELVRSTMHGGPLAARDNVGTSFAAPKVAAIGAALQSLFPTEPTLLYRALIANSARWPEWAERASNKLDVIRQLGYGIPDQHRATENTPHRITLITAGERWVKGKEAQIYQVPIPAELRSPGGEFNVRIDVTLSYVAKPRRTRRSLKQYLSTWVDWRSSQLGETVESFTNRTIRGGNRSLEDGEGTIPWKIREQDDWGEIEGVRRGNGTLQKDWAIVKSHELPADFCIAVVGHVGWDKDPDAAAKYSLTVSFEAIDQDLPLYSEIADAVRSVIANEEIEAELRTS